MFSKFKIGPWLFSLVIITELSKQSERISGIVQVIKGVADECESLPNTPPAPPAKCGGGHRAVGKNNASRDGETQGIVSNVQFQKHFAVNSGPGFCTARPL